MPVGASKLGVLGAGLVPGGSVTFNAPGTWPIPPGVKKVSITGRGGTGNPGNSGNAGNAGTLGFGGTGGGGGGGKTAPFENPCGPNRVRAGGSGGRVWTGTGGVLTNSSIQGGAGGYSGTVLPPYSVPANGSPGVTGTAGQAGASGQAGQAGNPGQASSGLGNNFAGGAGGNAGAAGNAGNGGSGGPSGGGGQGIVAGPQFNWSNPTTGGSGGTGAGNGGDGGGRGLPGQAGFKVGAGGGGGAGATNDGFSGENPCNRTLVGPENSPINCGGNTIGRGGTGGQTSGFSAPICCIAKGASFAPVNNNMANVNPPFNNIPPCGFPALLAVTGGSGGRQFPSPNAARPGDDAIGQSLAGTALRNPPSPRTPNTSMFQANVNNPIIRSGSGGGASAITDGNDPARRSGAGGGGGGRGGAGNPGGAGGAGGTGAAGTPQTFNCVPVTPGGAAPITVASPGGQIVISWNPQ